ncbi:acyltransferase family protein [Pseudomonas sp. yb_1]|uniref:acyltransferase family protein n=1 Tax=Pseudomonas sp. yb_1 TaxID=3367217 RepID=UPI00370C9182
MSRITHDQSQQLDSIRALSAFVVLIGHTNQTLLYPTLGMGATFIGFFTQLSVMVFFVLSGFLIGKSICNNTSKNATFSIKQYAIDRAIRIYPPLIAALMLMVALSIIAPYFFPSGTNSFLSIPDATFVRTGFHVVSQDLFPTLAFLNEFKTLIPSSLDAIGFLNEFKVYTPAANGPLWSLSIEVWYYAAAAAIFVWPTRKALSLALALVILSVTYTNQLFFMLAPVWFAGLGLAIIHHRKPSMNNRLFSRLFAFMSITVIISVVIVLIGEPSGKGLWLNRMNHFRLASGLWFACFLALLMGGAAKFPKLLHSQAKYSYTLYVTHFPIMLFLLGVFQKNIYGSVTYSFIASTGTIVTCIIFANLISKYTEDKKFLAKIHASTKRIFR